MTLNWYKFKIELFGVLWKTFLCVFTVISYRQTLLAIGQYSLMVPVELAPLAYRSWLLPVVMWSLIAVLWALYFKVFRLLRSRRAYGER
jgi:hypothetical protein